MYDIFISYRREGGRDYARQVELALKGHGYQSIFFDFNSLRNGVFNEQIIDAINGCKDYILILSKGSMDRCVKNDDWVAREIRTAIATGCNIIPLVIENFVGFPSDFPEDMKILRNIQHSQLLTNEYFNDSIKHLVQRLNSKPSIHCNTSRNENYVSSHDSAAITALNLKVKPNKDCRVVLDGEDLSPIAKANMVNKYPVNSGQYDLDCISCSTGEVWNQTIDIERKDILCKPLFKQSDAKEDNRHEVESRENKLITNLNECTNDSIDKMVLNAISKCLHINLIN